MGNEFENGLRVGRGSLVFTQKALSDSLGKWAKILPYLDSLSAGDELELVASINYLLGKPMQLTPPLQAAIANDFVRSSRKILISDIEFMLGLSRGEEHAQVQERKEEKQG